MMMSDGEIRRSWDQALNKKEHVRILAELNAVSESDMRLRLIGLGLIDPSRGKAKKKAEEPVSFEPMTVKDLCAALAEMAAAYPDAAVVISASKTPGVRLSVMYEPGQSPTAEVYLMG